MMNCHKQPSICLDHLISQIGVSSVLQKNSSLYGKQNLADGAEESCWSSEAGDRQWISVSFAGRVVITKICIRFQGGFCGKADSSSVLMNDRKINIHPEDSNKLQVFDFTAGSTAETCNKMRLIFNGSTDFYGRIVVYNLSIHGYEVQSSSSNIMDSSSTPPPSASKATMDEKESVKDKTEGYEPGGVPNFVVEKVTRLSNYVVNEPYEFMLTLAVILVVLFFIISSYVLIKSHSKNKKKGGGGSNKKPSGNSNTPKPERQNPPRAVKKSKKEH